MDCSDCKNYYGKGHGHETLVCAMHPYGHQGDSCEDFESARFLSPETAKALNDPRVIQALEKANLDAAIAIERLSLPEPSNYPTGFRCRCVFPIWPARKNAED